MHSVRRAAAYPRRTSSSFPSKPLRVAASAVLLVASGGLVHASCGSAFCSINTDWGAGTTGLAAGSTLDVRYENILQDQPSAGSRRVAVGEIPHHHDEVRTRNQNLVASYSRTFESGWGVSVTLPFGDRDHLHVHNHRGAQIPEQWHIREVGDIRVVGRYQRSLAGSDTASPTLGMFFGLKLPTGRTDAANGEGEVAERSLQPGSGSTDLIAGAIFHHQIAASGAAWFVQAQVQQPLNARDDFRPGAQAAVDVGYAHPLTDRFSGIVQFNAFFKRRDQGAQAEPEDSGGRFAFLSPGLSYKIGEALRLYGYYQHALHQDVNGVQLTARRSFVVGASTHF